MLQPCCILMGLCCSNAALSGQLCCSDIKDTLHSGLPVPFRPHIGVWIHHSTYTYTHYVKSWGLEWLKRCPDLHGTLDTRPHHGAVALLSWPATLLPASESAIHRKQDITITLAAPTASPLSVPAAVPTLHILHRHHQVKELVLKIHLSWSIWHFCSML